uniref:Uncharacterized protein n=1 Tax=Triticum urartu TaxID=4572 RepID=A0A8R7V319_TRIUA
MGSRFPSHQLSNGLYVSGRPEQPKEKAPVVCSAAMPYTGGDIKKSGELGKMFDLHAEKSRKSGPLAVPGTGGSARAKSNSGPLNKHGEPTKRSSGPQSGGVTPMARQNSGHLPPILPTTGLITSGPISSGQLNSSGALRKVSVVVVIFGFVAALLVWNICWGTRGMTRFVSRYPDADLRITKDGEYVKVTGVVTCGNFPLESSFQRVPRCVYTSSCLYEYRGWDSKAANTQHRRFTWGLRSIERHAVDFYISDFQSGLRALVKIGYGARLIPYVDEAVVIDINPENKDMSPEFLRWLRERNLSSDDRIMRLKEGYYCFLFWLLHLYRIHSYPFHLTWMFTSQLH